MRKKLGIALTCLLQMAGLLCLSSCLNPGIPIDELPNPNLLSNSSFEEGTGVEPDLWSFVTGGPDLPSEPATWSSSVARTGSRSILLKAPVSSGVGAGYATVVGCQSDEFIPVNHRETYRVSFYARTLPGMSQEVGMGLRFFDGVKLPLNSVVATGSSKSITGEEWQLGELLFDGDIPSDTAFVKVFVEVVNSYLPYSTDPVWIDDVEFAMVEPSAHAELPAPQLLDPATLAWVSSPVRFVWTEVSGAANYQINIRGDGDVGEAGGYLWASPSRAEYTADLSFITAFPDDDVFYWGVRAFDPEGRATQWSEVRTFRYSPP